MPFSFTALALSALLALAPVRANDPQTSIRLAQMSRDVTAAVRAQRSAKQFQRTRHECR